MIGERQDRKILENGEGLTHREMNWFKTCGRGMNGEFSTTCGVVKTNIRPLKMKITTTGGDGILPLRNILFGMDVIIKNLLEERVEDVAQKEGRCGTHLCTDCRNCEPF